MSAAIRRHRADARSRWTILRPICGSAAVLLGVSLSGSVSADCRDTAAFARLLARHTAEVADLSGVAVDYAGLRADADRAAALAALAACRPEALVTRAEQLAFWINAYNLLALDLVAQAWPVASIRDLGSLLRPVWKREAGQAGGRARSLDEIEHAILRPLGEPRIHGAIVCASRSCPPLAREPYTPEGLDAQLDASLRRWLADPRKGARLDAAGGTLWLSPVFDWFEEDFAAAGGAVAFVRPYMPEAVRAALPAAPRLRFLDYDWSVNAAR
jgi:hypothetical protein